MGKELSITGLTSVSQVCCHGDTGTQESYWSQALQDLESCGQSEILRELEATMMSGSTLSLGEENDVADEAAQNPPPVQENQNWENGTGTERKESDISVPLELHKICVQKDADSRDFGFSVSDGLLEKGVFVNMIRPEGPADQAGLRPFDRILQVNHVRTRDFDCCLAVPLMAESGDQLQLVICRNPLTQAPRWGSKSRQDLSLSLALLPAGDPEKTSVI